MAMQHIGRNIFSLVLSRVISGVILFLIYTRLVQYLGPEQAGYYGLIASYLTVFSFFVDIGMSQLVIKKISEEKENAKKYLSNYFIIQFLLALAFMVIMDAFIFFADYPQELKVSLYVAAFGLLTTSISLPFRAVIIAYQNLTLTAKVNFFNSLINAAIMVLTIALHKGVLFLALITVFIGLFDLIVYGIVVHKKFVAFSLDMDRDFIKKLLILNLPFTLLTLFSIYNRVDGLILPHLRSFTENGYYSAAYKFWDTLAFVPGVIGISLYPFFAESLKRNAIDDVKKGLETYTRYMIALGVPMSVGAFLLAKPITLSFYGNDFLPAAPALWLLVTAVSVLFIYTPINSLMVSQLTKTATKITCVTLIFNVTANLVFIPIYGFVVAAAVTLISELIQTVGYTIAVKRHIVQFSFLVNFIKPIIASAIMAAAILLLGDLEIWLVIAIAGIVYTAALLLIKFFHREDFELLKAAVSFKKPVTPDGPLT